MVCKLCPTRKHCWDKGDCETCDYGKAFEGYNKKLKRYKAKNEQLEAENEALRKQLAENENGYAQTLYLERLKNKDLSAEVERLNKEVDRLSQVVLYNDSITEMEVCEAIEKFAKRLCDGRVSNDTVVIATQCLLKEMMGEQI